MERLYKLLKCIIKSNVTEIITAITAGNNGTRIVLTNLFLQLHKNYSSKY